MTENVPGRYKHTCNDGEVRWIKTGHKCAICGNPMSEEWARAYADAYPDRLADYVALPDGGVTDEPDPPNQGGE